MSFCVTDYDAENNIVYLEDTSGPNERTITNDAETVMMKMFQKFGSRVLVVYRDTNNEWWEMRLLLPGPYNQYEQIEFEPWYGLAWRTLKRK